MARSMAGSIRATTLRRRPSLLLIEVRDKLERLGLDVDVLFKAERVIPWSFIRS